MNIIIASESIIVNNYYGIIFDGKKLESPKMLMPTIPYVIWLYMSQLNICTLLDQNCSIVMFITQAAPNCNIMYGNIRHYNTN